MKKEKNISEKNEIMAQESRTKQIRSIEEHNTTSKISYTLFMNQTERRKGDWTDLLEVIVTSIFVCELPGSPQLDTKIDTE